MNAVVSEKGQVTIPKKLRTDLGLDPGTVLQFKKQGGKIIVSKKVDVDPVDEWVGFAELPIGKSVDAYLKTVRER